MEKLPQHLKKYIVTQDSTKYTPIDQAVWRFILRQLKNFLSKHGHESYLEGLEKTGITPEEIPSISELSKNLEKFGWRALPVSGFIPPAAFMELQSLNVLPIASDMRSLEHLLYTPAPDIVHEAAGHAPLLIHPEFSSYLRKYAQVAKRALISKEDLALYEAIRVLSDLKENPTSKPEQILAAEDDLNKKSKSISHISEASELSRMNWWTAEYGLIGDIKNPKIYGAGLLSSVGESRWCLSEKVKKLPLTLDCIKYTYDITEPQPQLFVTPDFKTLETVLEEMAESMAFKTGGIKGLDKAIKTEVVNTVEVDGVLQIGGQLESYLLDSNHNLAFIKFNGPTQLAVDEKELPGHDKSYHQHGFSSPLGKLKGIQKNPNEFTDNEWLTYGLEIGKEIELNYASGFKVSGVYLGRAVQKGKTVLLKFKNATATYKDEVFFKPEWGYYDILLGEKISSVFAGPADRIAYGEVSDFAAMRVQKPHYSEQKLKVQKLYQDIRFLRNNESRDENLLLALEKHFKSIQELSPEDWLLPLEILELCKGRCQEKIPGNAELQSQLVSYLKNLQGRSSLFAGSIADGLALSDTL